MRKILLVLAAFIFFKAQAQTPIQVNAQLLPPYSLQVSDYYSPTATGGQKLNLILLNRDFLRATINVRLRMVIESQGVRIATREDVTWPIVTLISGTPYYVTPAELASYFNPNNLIFSGISQEQYTSTGKLPEGFYTFCFETIEPATGLTVSNKGCAFAWITISDPPFLNIPAKAETVTPNASQNINFQWTPRHNASPTAGYNTDYVFSITEVMANDFSPESAFTSHQALYTDSTAATMYNYGPAKPLLIAGRRYAWRVQAKAKQGLDNLAMFRNNGHSEVFWFDYKNNCTPPTTINAQVQGSRVTITWQPLPIYLSYKVDYREANNASAEWFTINTLEPTVVLNDLNFSKTYEYRVGANCEEESFNYSNLLSFTTGGAAVPVIVNCGDSSAVPNTVPQTYLATMAVGDTILAGDFKVKILTISGSTSFTGTGTVKIPWLLGVKAAVRFNGIKVNTAKQLAVGNIETTYDPKEAGILNVDDVIDIFCAGCNVGNVITGQAGADTTVKFPIQWPGGITAVPGLGYNPPTVNGPATITVTGVGGTPVITIVAQTLPKTIMDSTGTIYQVNNTNPITVTLIGKAGGKDWLARTTKSLIDADKAIVKFITYYDPKVQYAFDEWNPLYKKSGTFNKEYEKISCAGGGDCIDGGAYYVSAKAIAPGKTDYLKATVTLTDYTINPDSIQFVNGKGIIYTKKRVDSAANVYRYEIAVVGGPEKDAQEIYALYPRTGSKTFNLGKVLVASYPIKEYKVKLIPTSGATVNLSLIQAKLDSTYSKLGIKIAISQDSPFNDDSWDQAPSGLAVTGSGTLTSLTSEMKQLIATYKNSRNTESDSYYLFVLPNAEVSTIKGAMPRSKKFGYIFTNTSTVERTIVHELGHGIFTFKHISEYDGFIEGSLQSNLMDNGGGINLTKHQWDLTADPGFVLNFLEDDEDALSNENLTSSSDFILTNAINKTKAQIIACLPPQTKQITVQLSNLQVVKISLTDILTLNFENGKLIELVKTNNQKYINAGARTVKHMTNIDGKKAVDVFQSITHFVCWDKVKSDFENKVKSNGKLLVEGEEIIDMTNNNEKSIIYKYDGAKKDYVFNTTFVKDCPTEIFYIDNNGACQTRTLTQEECNNNNLVCGKIKVERFDDFFKDILNANFIEQAKVNTKLDSIDACILKNLSFDARKKLYYLLFEDAVIAHPMWASGGEYLSYKCDNKEKYLLVELLKTATKPEQQWFAQDYIFRMNRTATNFVRFMNYNSDFELKAQVAAELQKMVMQNKDIKFTPQTTLVNIPGQSQQLKMPNCANPIFIFFENWLSDPQIYNPINISGHSVAISESHIDADNGRNELRITQKGIYKRFGQTIGSVINDEYLIHPYEMVKIYFAKDMQNYIGFKVGDSVVTTAFMASIINQIGKEVARSQNVKIGITFAALASAAFTGGTSLAAIAGGETLGALATLQLASNVLVVTTSSINLVVLSKQDNNTLTANEMAALQNWNSFYNKVLLVDAGLNLFSAVRSLQNEFNLISGPFANLINTGNFSKIFGAAKNVKLTPVSGGLSSISSTNNAYTCLNTLASEARVVSLTPTVRTWPNAFNGSAALKLEQEFQMYVVQSPLTKVIEMPAVSGGAVVNATLKYYQSFGSSVLAGTTEIITATYPNASPVIVYASAEALEALDDKEKENAPCTACNRGATVCIEFDKLRTKYPLKLAAIQKLCTNLSNINVYGIVKKMNVVSFPTSDFLNDIDGNASVIDNIASSSSISKLNDDMLNAWEYLYRIHDTKAINARKMIYTLDVFSRITTSAKSKIVLYTDNESGSSTSTLKAFCLDVKSTTDFVKIISERQDIVNSFLGHKPTVYTNAKYENITDDDILKPLSTISLTLQNKINYWIKYSEDIAQMQDNFQKGKTFETYIIDVIKNKSDPALISSLEQEIGNTVDDPSIRILSQAYFCLPNENCNGQKGYFIADLVFLKYNASNIIEKMIVADIKLSQGTNLTSNQEVAKLAVNSPFKIKTIPNGGRDIKNVLLPVSTYLVGTSILMTKFIEIHGNGNGTYSQGGIIK
jgi:hypothetical protein